MIAIEFQTRVKDGIIEVPPEYRDQIVGAVRVIVLSQAPAPSSGIIAELLEHPIQDPSFAPLPREEIYRDRT
jgi:hypothetical protein